MFKLFIIVWVAVISSLQYALGERVNNGVVDSPIIECTGTALRFRLKTRNNFEGRLFVKGYAGTSGCFIQGQGKFNETGIEVPFDSPCRIDRERSANPRGVFVTTTIVVSFHPLFITSVDRAYRVKCLYFAKDQKVNIKLGVHGLPPHLQRAERMVMPVCRYELLDGGPNGHNIAYATVGQQIYHKWICEPQTSDQFCMIVHSCIVDSGLGEAVEILDSRGCALDPLLLTDLEYSTDLVAGQGTQVYKYADRDTLFFQCQISISAKKANSMCPKPDCLHYELLATSDQPPIVVAEKLNVRVPRNLLDFEVMDIVDVSSHLQAIENFSNTTLTLPKAQKQEVRNTEICFPFAALFFAFGWLLIIIIAGSLFVYLRLTRSRTYQIN